MKDTENQKLVAQMKEGVGGTLSGLVGGAFTGMLTGGAAGRAASKDAVQNFLGQQPTQQQIPPKPEYMPTNNTPQQPQQGVKSSIGANIKKAATNAFKGIQAAVSGGDPEAQKTIKSFAKGEPQAQLNAQDPQRAKAFIDDMLSTLSSLANMRMEAPKQKQAAEQSKESTNETQVNESFDKSIQDFRQRYLEKTDTAQMISAAKQFAATIKGKTSADLTDQELQALQRLMTSIADKHILKQLIQHANSVGNTGIAGKLQKLTPQNIQALPQAIQTISQNRDALTEKPKEEQQVTTITKNTKKNAIHGAIVDALVSLPDDKKQAATNHLSVIIQSNGGKASTRDFSKYSWEDIEAIVEVLQKLGSPIAIDMTDIDPSTSPGGAKPDAQQPQSAGEQTALQQPQPQEDQTQELASKEDQTQELAPKEVSKAVGTVLKHVQKDPEAVKALLQKVLKNPANRDEFYRRYNLNSPNIK
jgi:hypothetical protein